MGISTFLTRMHEDERTGENPVALAARVIRKIRSHTNSQGLEDRLLLITHDNAVRVPTEYGEYFFHRGLAQSSADNQTQHTLLRRARRAVHNMYMVEQQRMAVSDNLKNVVSHDPSRKPGYPFTDPDTLTLTDESSKDSLTQSLLERGMIAWNNHQDAIRAILKRDPAFEDIMLLGEDVMALELVGHVRKKAQELPAPAGYNDANYNDNGHSMLRQSIRSLPPDTLRLYQRLEIPFVQTGDAITGNVSHTSNGAIQFGSGEGYLESRFIAAHELCHALIGHDFTNSRYLQLHDNRYAVPDEIIAAGDEFHKRMEAVIANDPAIIRHWLNQSGQGMTAFNELRDVLIHLKNEHQNDENQKIYEQNGYGWDYELVCNYYGLRQSAYANDDRTMTFLSPKAAALCNKLDANTHLKEETLKRIDSYYDNPQRDALFALVQQDNKQVSLPAVSRKR